MSFLQQSIAIHISLLVVFSFGYFLLPTRVTTINKVPVQIIEAPVALEDKPKSIQMRTPPKAEIPNKKKPEPVFGISNDTLRDQTGASTVEIKRGNTIAKEIDQTKALNDDALPIPTDEYLVTVMPRLRREVRAAYPEAARAAKVEGPVVIEILIDEYGRVVDAKLISGLGNGLDEAALNAIRQFEFEPAKVQDQKVAVRIRYTYRFELR